MNKKTEYYLKFTRWIIINGAFSIMLWYGFVENVEGAKNCAIFSIWTLFLLSFVALTKDYQQDLAVNGRSVPKSIENIYDTCIIFFLVWFGMWGLATAYAFHFFFLEMAQAGAKKIRDNAVSRET